MDLQTAIQWLEVVGSIGAGALVIAGAIVRNERRMAKFLTIESHDETCGRNQQELKAYLMTINGKLDRQDEQSDTFRKEINAKVDQVNDTLNEKVGVLRTEVAVLKSRGR